MENHGLSDEELKRVLAFEGYGNKTAPDWFLGMEEGGGSIEELKVRAHSFGPVEDLRLAHEKLGWGDMRQHVPTWRVMSKIVMALEGTNEWQGTARAREYQANTLGRAGESTFLTELMPLPCPSIAAWPYPKIFPTKEDYYADIRPNRIRWLRSEISTSQPRMVICYGKGNWPHHMEIFDNVEFRPHVDGRIRVGQYHSSKIILLPFLSYDLVPATLIEQIAHLFRHEVD